MTAMDATLADYAASLENSALNATLATLYGETGRFSGGRRLGKLLETMRTRFGDGPAIAVSVPGRTELGGNHTDHNHGRVLAAAVHLDCLAVASPSSIPEITLLSELFPEPIRVDLASTAPRPEEEGRAEALIRGVADGFRQKGLNVGGFNATLSSLVPVGSGLSSSAAFELTICAIFNHLFNQGAVSELEQARFARRAENLHFGKPCGFMDQLSCAIKGVLLIDLLNPDSPDFTSIEYDFEKTGYGLAMVETGGDHSNLTAEYAAIASEMRAAARVLGREVLRGASLSEAMTAIPEIRRAAGDRAVLRCIHFIEENERVDHLAAALAEGRLGDYFRLARASGDSSWRLLQNCASAADPASQPIMLALAMTERFLEGQGACRIQGGGFAGSIQAYVPVERLKEYQEVMEKVFGQGAVVLLRTRGPSSALIRA